METLLTHLPFLALSTTFPKKIKRAYRHDPVLLEASIDHLNIKEGGVYVDCTTNRGGHSVRIAKVLGKNGTLVCIDLDRNALQEAQTALGKYKNVPTIHFVQGNFRNIKTILSELGIHRVDGVLADLGLSSQELDSSKRGFSFRFDEPLLMTFDDKPPEDMTTATDIVNFWNESTIADILFGFADERYAKRIAHAIIEARKVKPISTTFQLVDIIASAIPALYRHKPTHFATKTFQALRMATNDELGSIQELITSLPSVLNEQGRACFITFHSTEDRIVKQELKKIQESIKFVSKKAITPSLEEITTNPRSRSAQLRVVERV